MKYKHIPDCLEPLVSPRTIERMPCALSVLLLVLAGVFSDTTAAASCPSLSWTARPKKALIAGHSTARITLSVKGPSDQSVTDLNVRLYLPDGVSLVKTLPYKLKADHDKTDESVHWTDLSIAKGKTQKLTAVVRAL